MWKNRKELSEIMFGIESLDLLENVVALTEMRKKGKKERRIFSNSSTIQGIMTKIVNRDRERKHFLTLYIQHFLKRQVQQV